jgi:hypothetical protein
VASEPIGLRAPGPKQPNAIAPGEAAGAGSSAARLSGRVAALLARGRQRRAGHVPVSSSALNEELAVALLYGRRSGSVSASPARPPR